MSRIGNAPIEIPAGVEVKIENDRVTIKGPKGELARTIVSGITVKQEDNQVIVKRSSDDPDVRALHGLTRSLLNNMVIGVSDGFEKKLELVGVGYRAKKKGNNLEILVGYSKPVNIEKPEGIEFEVDGNTKVSVKGVDKELVGQVASDIRSVRPPEPYKGKGIKYADERVRRKAGKAAKAAGAE
ncbi:hypothetical protein LCGC14_1286830 [marine sediment metagenome]|uniref:Large ribosomal subunit protein uL6 alpha-beta domain-containing protein n=1 Tax=marine sediment metagenome TaxID=412755 RepID=A0A0F9LEJ0_9ZZZZ